MKVSVIIPVFNGEKTVKRTVGDLLEGSLQDMEVILVDDGSTDGSGKVCEELTAEDPRIRLYQKENGGPGSARNYGLDRAQGEFVAFIDDDDRVDPDYLQKLSNCLEENDLDWVVCGHRRIHMDGDDPGQPEITEPVFPKKTILRGEDGRVEVIRTIFTGIEGKNLFSNAMGMYRRSLLEIRNLRIPERARYGEDTLFNYMVARHIRGFAYLPEPLYTYVIHGNSASAKLTDDRLLYREEMDLVEELDRLRGEAGDEWTDPMLRYATMQILVMFRVQILPMGSGDRWKAYREVKERFTQPPFPHILSRLRREHVESARAWVFLILIRNGWYRGLDLIWGITHRFL